MSIRTNLPLTGVEAAGLFPQGSAVDGSWRGACEFALTLDDARLFAVRRQGRVLARFVARDEAISELRKQIQLYIAVNAPDHVFLHAGVVAVNGRAVVLPGRSFAGKSTLVRALVGAGAAYYSDEFAVVSADGLVHPFPVGISVRAANGPVRLECVTSATADIPVGVVILTEYDRNGKWQPRRLTPGVAALELLRHTLAGRTRPHKVLGTVGKLVMTSPVYMSARHEASCVVDWIREMAKS